MVAQAAALEPDRNQIEIFVDAIFRHAKAGVVSLRSFYEGEDKVFRIEPVPTNATDFYKYLCDVAEDIARRAAQDPKPVVFCPPLCTFREKKGAGEADLVEGYTLSVECDENPEAARAKLEPLLGPVTVAVRSGGIWQSNGAAYDKSICTGGSREPATQQGAARQAQARAGDRLPSGRRRPHHRAGLSSAALAGLLAPQGRAAAVRDHRRGVELRPRDRSRRRRSQSSSRSRRLQCRRTPMARPVRARTGTSMSATSCAASSCTNRSPSWR